MAEETTASPSASTSNASNRERTASREVALVAVDSSKPDLDEGEIGREHYGWIEEGFADRADLRIFVCHLGRRDAGAAHEVVDSFLRSREG